MDEIIAYWRRVWAWWTPEMRQKFLDGPEPIRDGWARPWLNDVISEACPLGTPCIGRKRDEVLTNYKAELVVACGDHHAFTDAWDANRMTKEDLIRWIS